MAYSALVGSSSSSGFVDAVTLTQIAPTPVQTVTPEMIQPMIVSTFSGLVLPFLVMFAT